MGFVTAAKRSGGGPFHWAGSRTANARDGSASIAFDGRIDNRRALGALAHEDDASLALRVYARDPSRFPQDLVGDFACVVVDHVRDRMLLARDFLGRRPLYYAQVNGAVHASTTFEGLLGSGAVSRAKDEATVAMFLSASPPSDGSTLWASIRRVLPGHVVVAERGRLASLRYWAPDLTEELDVTFEEACRRLEQLLETAVGETMGTDPAIQLSGGVDSSTVAGFCAAAEPRSLRAYAVVFPGHREADESSYLDAVDAHLGLDVRRLEGAALPVDDDVSQRSDLPMLPNAGIVHAILNAMTADGRKTLLTGDGGDDTLTASMYVYADLLSSLRWADLRRLVREHRTVPTVTLGRFPILSYAVRPMVPGRWVAALRQRLGRRAAPQYVRRSFADRTGLERRLAFDARPPHGVSYARFDALAALRSGWLVHGLEQNAHLYDRFGVQVASPLFDRRIVELALRLPPAFLSHGQIMKRALVSAAGARLPSAVARRTTKSDFSHLFAEALRARARTFAARDLAIADAGFVEPAPLRALYERTMAQYRAGDPRYAAHVLTLWMAYSVEKWLTTC